MPIAYLIHPGDKNLRLLIEREVSFVFIFDSASKWGERMKKSEIESVTLHPATAKVIHSFVSEPLYIPRDYREANYLLWRRFMVHYHLLQTDYATRRKSRLARDGYELRLMRTWIENNRSVEEALKLFKKLDDILISDAMHMAKVTMRLQKMDVKGFRFLMNLAVAMHKAWMAYCGWPWILGSIYMLPAIYTALTYGLEFRFDDRDFDEKANPSKRMLTIFCRLFEEKAVHGFGVRMEAERRHLQIMLDAIEKGSFTMEDYLFGRSLM